MDIIGTLILGSLFGFAIGYMVCEEKQERRRKYERDVDAGLVSCLPPRPEGIKPPPPPPADPPQKSPQKSRGYI